MLKLSTERVYVLSHSTDLIEKLTDMGYSVKGNSSKVRIRAFLTLQSILKLALIHIIKTIKADRKGGLNRTLLLHHHKFL